MKQRIYIDTSVVGGFFDDEFRDPTQRLFKRLENDEIKFVISDLLELELIQAPKYVSELLLKYPRDRYERIEFDRRNDDFGRQIYYREGSGKHKPGGLPTYCISHGK